MRKKLTDRAVKLLKPRSARYEVWDTNYPGFGVRVSPAGRKSWVYLYRFDGRPRRMTLGVYPRMGLAKARAAYGKARGLLEEQQRDPGAEHVRARQERHAAPTVNDLAAVYVERWAKPNKRSWREDLRKLQTDVCPIIGHKKADDVTRRDIRDVLDVIVDRGAPVAAGRVLAVVRKMYRWALSEDLVTRNPCDALKMPALAKDRDRVLSEAEIRQLWAALDNRRQVAMTRQTRLCLKLMLVTAQRRVEVATARWADIDLTKRWWIIPKEVAKNNKQHRVPLSPLAIRLLKTAKAESQGNEGQDYVFPKGCGPIRPESVTKSVRYNADRLKLDDFTPHDLRRTAATQMAELGTPVAIIGRVLNHSEKSTTGVTAVYNRYSYDPEKRKALNAWARRLELILQGKAVKVVSLVQSTGHG